MENGTHKGSEFKNIIETWEENERRKEKEGLSGTEGTATTEASTGSDLDQLIKQEAAEYDNENKENRVLTGDRATINDEPGSNASEE